MAFVPQPKGLFVPTSIIYDTSQILSVDVNSPEFKSLLVKLYQSVNNISIALNQKTTGNYPNQEVLSGNLIYSNTDDATQLRPTYFMTYNIGDLPVGLTTIPHGLAITNTWQFVHIYGGANDTVGFNYFPIPSFNIIVALDAVNININNGTGFNFTTSSVVLEYSKT